MKLDPRYWWILLYSIALMLVASFGFQNTLTYTTWKYIHIVSASIFFGLVLTSSLIEWFIYQQGDVEFARQYHAVLERLDKKVITLSISSLLFSAMAMMQHLGFSLFVIQEWPWWSSMAFVCICILGIIWAVFDITSQQKLNRLFHKPVESYRESYGKCSEKDSQHKLKGNQSDQDHKADLKTQLSSFQKLYKYRMYLNAFSNALILYVFYLMVHKPM